MAQPALYARTAKAASELSDTVRRFGDYKGVLVRITEARHILNDDRDREMREMAQAEIDGVKSYEWQSGSGYSVGPLRVVSMSKN